jgi:four helix bundle protein
LLKRLNQPVQQQPIETPIAEADVILVMLVKGVRGTSSGQIPGAYSHERLSMPPPRSAARSFRDLLVWRKAHELVLAIYQFTAGFPKQETYGLALQIRRAAVWIPANIAEGFRRRGKAEKARYMNIAEGSLEESRYYLMLAKDLAYGDTAQLASALEEVSRPLSAYAAAILTSSTSDSHIPEGYQGRSPWLVSSLDLKHPPVSV